MLVVKNKTLFFLITAILIICYVFVRNTLFLSDEIMYYPSIREIARGVIGNQTFARFSVLPGYVIVQGAIIHLLGLSYAKDAILIPVIRGISVVISFFTVLIFFIMSKKMSEKDVSIKTLQFFLFPVIFPFFFLIYTEIFSLLFILASFYLLLKKKYLLSCIVALMSIFIRQDNIFWILFYCVYIFLDTRAYTWKRETIVAYLKNISVFGLSFSAIAILFILNKGNAAIGFNAAHPVSFHLGNIYFFLVILFLFFLPLHISHARRIVCYVRERPIIAFLIAITFLPFFSFRIDHPDNQLAGAGTYFLHNDLLYVLSLNWVSKFITYCILIWTSLSLAVTQFHRRIFYSIYPCIFLALSANWLIETRYYFVPVTFFILFKKEESDFVTISTVLCYIVLTVIITVGVFNNGFFL